MSSRGFTGEQTDRREAFPDVPGAPSAQEPPKPTQEVEQLIEAMEEAGGNRPPEENLDFYRKQTAQEPSEDTSEEINKEVSNPQDRLEEISKGEEHTEEGEKNPIDQIKQIREEFEKQLKLEGLKDDQIQEMLSIYGGNFWQELDTNEKIQTIIQKHLKSRKEERIEIAKVITRVLPQILLAGGLSALATGSLPLILGATSVAGFKGLFLDQKTPEQEEAIIKRQTNKKTLQELLDDNSEVMDPIIQEIVDKLKASPGLSAWIEEFSKTDSLKTMLNERNRELVRVVNSQLRYKDTR